MWQCFEEHCREGKEAKLPLIYLSLWKLPLLLDLQLRNGFSEAARSACLPPPPPSQRGAGEKWYHRQDVLLVLAVLLINHHTTFHYFLLIITLFDHSDLCWLNHHLIDKVYGNANVSCQLELHTWPSSVLPQMRGKGPLPSRLQSSSHCQALLGGNMERQQWKPGKTSVHHSKMDLSVIISYTKTASAAETSSGIQGKKIYSDFQEWLVAHFLVLLLIIFFLTKWKISLSSHNVSLFLPFFFSPFSFFFSLFNRFVFRSIRLVITRTQSSIFLLLERLLQCDGQIVRNNYTKWWKKNDGKDLSLPVIRFI